MSLPSLCLHQSKEKQPSSNPAMPPLFLFLFFLLLSYSLTPSFAANADLAPEPHLTEDYYNKTCPQFHETLRRVVIEKQMTASTTAAAMLRMFFHDCMVEGCDSSVLISSNAFNKAERDADINLSLPGDGFDLVTRIKTVLEIECPGIVSCTDIMAVATRDLISMVGGPYYKIRLGRKDGFSSKAAGVEYHLAEPTLPLNEIIFMFEKKGLSIQEMVALTGAHTIGFAHCKEFAKRLYNFSNTVKTDPEINSKYAEGLKQLCHNYTVDSTMSAFNDVMTPNKFDNMYYLNLQKGLGLMASDQAIATDKRTRPLVDHYAANQTAFFEDFGRAMEKVSEYLVKTGSEGEVRNRCDAFNTLKT